MTVSDFIKLGQVSDVPVGQVKIFQAGSVRIAVCNVEEQYYAIADLCTHDNGPLGEGELFNDQIECPRHGARFNVKTGNPLCLPAVVPVPTYPVEVRDGALWVNVSPNSK
ncbi:MAG: non-heme iron oxygenase ferredoxin subunit [Candidatus Melainabacteria bacterium]|nr:non-heme iron oxygenase ferredoxin subunit [Candidatus Melainabacteria bacterium]